MTKRRIAFLTLALAAAMPTAAFADPDHDDGRGRWEEHRRDRDDRVVWVQGRYEDREVRRVVPAVTRDEWVPERREEVVVPAVTEVVRVPAVVERVYVPAVVERVWVPEVRERVGDRGGIQIRWNGHGVDLSVGRDGCDEVRVRPAHWEDRCVSPAHYEDRVVTPARCETRIIAPERREMRVVEAAHVRTVIVCAERVEFTRERVWIPGHYEQCRERRCD
jgi:hypothetical protein